MALCLLGGRGRAVVHVEFGDDCLFVLQDEETVDDVFELAQISRPIVLAESVEQLGGDGHRLEFVLLCA